MAKKWMQAASARMEKKGTKGSFTRWAKTKGMGVQQAARMVRKNPERYSTLIRKRANFAHTAGRIS